MSERCAYCKLPGHMANPFSEIESPICRVDFEQLAGALDFDDVPPTADEILASYERTPFTDAERVEWEHMVRERFGPRCVCGAAEVNHHDESPVTSGCVVTPQRRHKCPCLGFTLRAEVSP